jgi:phage baseplate assembly protein gpV/phage protein D
MAAAHPAGGISVEGTLNQILALPQVVIELDGAPLASSDVRALGEVRVKQRLSAPTLCEIIFRDPPGPLTTVSRLAPGAALRLTMPGHSEPLFVGQVTGVEHVYEPAHGREVRVRGYDLLHRLRKRQSVRAHVQVTLRDLARELVSDLGLSVQTASAGPVWQRLIQHRQSDLELLVELAEQSGLYLAQRENVVHLLTLDGLGEPLPLTLGKSLLEARVEVNGDPACRSVTAAGWDPLQVKAFESRATAARVGRKVAADVAPGQVGGSGQRELVNEAAHDESQAGNLAQAELDGRVAREVTLWGIAEGDPRLRPGTPITVSGIIDSLVGQYVLTCVTHTIDERRGFVSEISTVPPAPHPRPISAVAALGVVTSVDDPQNLARIKVSLPAYGDVETNWMHVQSPGAGSGKGLATLPDVGDHVLVLLAHEDPGQGVVLGGLYGMQGAPDSGVERGAVRRYTLLTRGGQRIRLDDAHDTIRVENSQGSFVELAPNKVRVHAAVDLEIEAPGKAVVIRGQTIDFERA